MVEHQGTIQAAPFLSPQMDQGLQLGVMEMMEMELIQGLLEFMNYLSQNQIISMSGMLTVAEPLQMVLIE